MPPCTKFSIFVNGNSILPVAQVQTFGFSFNSPIIQYPSQVQSLPGATPRCGPCRFISLHPMLSPYSRHDSPCLHFTNNLPKQSHCICSCPLESILRTTQWSLLAYKCLPKALKRLPFSSSINTKPFSDWSLSPTCPCYPPDLLPPHPARFPSGPSAPASGFLAVP